MPYTIKEINRFVPRAERERYSKDPAENSVLGNIRLLLEELEDVPDRSGSLKADRMFLNNVLDAADGKLAEEKGDAAIRAVNSVIQNISTASALRWKRHGWLPCLYRKRTSTDMQAPEVGDMTQSFT